MLGDSISLLHVDMILEAQKRTRLVPGPDCAHPGKETSSAVYHKDWQEMPLSIQAEVCTACGEAIWRVNAYVCRAVPAGRYMCNATRDEM